MAEKIIQTEYSDEMQKSYINYSMSVITSRAVPDVRDGLKPVQRRVLYAMNTLGLNYDKPHKKCARIVGDAMGKFHPHGDSSIYEALVVLAQDFKKSMILVDGHGNFGSIEGDTAAAMRYTEARLKKFTQEVYLKDLDKKVVDFMPNYDETEKEPTVLPVRVPNLLINGSEGIAVGMTTSTPTHNLAEVVDAMVYYIDHPEATTAELLDKLHGPDFPTGGIVVNKADLLDIYETGKGKIKIRGKAELVKATKKSDRDKIVISEIPYTMIGLAIGKFQNDIAELYEKKVFPDIYDISNLSDKDGIRIVIELKQGADGEKILNGLYKKTKLEDTFGVNMLCIVDGRPEVLGLKRILEENLKFQLDVNRRKYRTLLDKENKRKEVLEGLIKATDVIDLIIEIVRGTKKIQTARECLMTGKTDDINFKSELSKKLASELRFTEDQTNAILALQIQKLCGLEILALKGDYKDTVARIKEYERLLKSEDAMKGAIKEDLESIKKEFALPRRTVLTDEEEAVYEEEPEVAVPVLFTMNKFGYCKQYDLPTYEKSKDQIREEAKEMIFTMSNGRLMIFTDKGLLHQLKMKDVPMCKMKDKGVPIDNISTYDSANENILKMDSYENLMGKTLLFVTSRAMIKRVETSEFDSIKKMVASTKLNDDDRLIYVSEITGTQTVLVTKKHDVLKFPNEDISVYKKTSVGVRGMKLRDGDEIETVYDFDPEVRLAVKIGTKRVDLGKLKLKKRDAKPETIK